MAGLNPGKVVTPNNVAELFCQAYLGTGAMDLATSGFKATGIWPYNGNIFPEEEFIAAYKTSDDETNEGGANCH